MRKELLNQRPTSALRGQSPLCESVGAGHTSTHPSIFTKALLVLLTMLLLPSTVWGQEPEPTIKTYFSGFDNGVTYASGTTGTWSLYTDSENTFPGTSDDPEGISISNTNYIPYFDFTSDFQLYGTLKKGQKIARVEFEGDFNSLSLKKVGSKGATGGEVIALQSGSNSKDLILTEDIDFSSGQYIDIYFVPNNTQSVVIESIKIYNLQTAPITVSGNSPDADGKISGEGITGTVTFDAQNSTLTLKNAKIDGKILSQTLTINLEGTNTINGSILLNNDAVSEGTLAFTGAEGSSLTINDNSYCAIYNYNSVDFGELNLATNSSPGVYYDNAEDTKALCTQNYGGGKALVSNLTITTKTVYPLWIAQAETSDLIQVTEDNKNDILGDSNVSFTVPQTLTLSNGASITKGIISGLSGLTIVVDGENTITNEADSTTCIRNFAPNATLTIQKSDSETCSLSLTGINFIKDFSSISYGEGIYLSSAKDGQGNDLNAALVYYEYDGFRSTFESWINSLTFSTTKPSESIWIGETQVGTDGNFNGIEGVSFDSEKNILTLNNAKLQSKGNIISSLPNLTIKLTGEDETHDGRSDLDENSYIISTNSSATLTFTTDGDNSLCSTIDNYELPWKGFAGNPTFENKLVFLQAAGTMSIQVLQAPIMSYSSGNLTFSGLSDGYSNKFDCYYTIIYEDGIGDPGITKYEPGEGEQPIPVSMEEKPCTVTAYVTYKDKLDNTTQSETAIGKYFAIADKTIVFNNETKGKELSVNNSDESIINLEIIPATEGEGVSFNIRGVDNPDVIIPSSTEGNGYKYSIAGIGRCEVSAEINVNNPTIQVLNPFEGSVSEVKYAKGVVTVLPDKPTITITKKDTERDYYLNTDEIAITRTSVGGEVADNIKIFYTWNADAEVGSSYIHDTNSPILSIYDSTDKIPAQTGTLRAWAGYGLGDNEYLMSEPESQEFTVKTDIAKYTIKDLAASTPYTGAAITPTFTVEDQEKTELASTNYTVSYQKVETTTSGEGADPTEKLTDVEEMVEVGSYKIVVTGTGDYGGSKSVDFEITKANLNIVTIEAIADQTYTGSAITLEEVTVTLNGEQVSSDEYEITYSNNTNVSTETEKASVTITATASSIHFTQGTTQTAPFNITPKSIEGVTVTLSGDGFDSEKNSFVYNGQNQKPTVTVKDGETLLTQNKDYTLTNEGGIIAGEYPVTVTGMGNYNKTTTATFTISKGVGVLNAPEPIGDLIYTGDPQTLITEAKPVNTTGVVRYSLDYSLSTDQWSTELPKGTNAGNYNIYYMVEGDDNYSGVDKKEDAYITATINQADLAGAAISKIAFGGKEYTVGDLIEIPYTGEAIQPTVEEVTFNDGTVTVDASDYNVSYSNNTEISSDDNLALIIITSTGKNFTEGTSTSQGFKIVRATVTITAENQTVTYNADKQEYDISKIEVSNNNAKLAITYYAKEADRSNGENALAEAPTNADTYYVRVTLNEESQQHYVADPADATFTIDQLEMTNDNTTITLDKTELTYNNGETLTVNVTKVMVGEIEVPAECYEVSDNTATEAGDYKLTVTAKTKDSQGNAIKNNFTGSAEKDWKIKNRTVTAKELGLSEDQPQATYYSDTENLEVPDGVVANIITSVSDGMATTQRISNIPKGVPVFVELTTSSGESLTEIPDPSQLPLKGTAEPKDVTSISGGTVFVLYKGEFVKSITGTIPAHRCYLLLSNDVAAGTRAFGIIRGIGGSNGSTAIKSIEIDNTPSTIENWYDMRGRRIEKPTKTGIYIKDGKKVVINNK